MQLINSFDIYNDFLETNPIAKVVLGEASKGIPSQHLWAVFLYAHPDSDFFSVSPEERKQLIYEDYLQKDPTFKWEDYSELISLVEDKLLTKVQRALMRWEKTLHERDDFIASIAYTLDTFEAKDKMVANTPKLWDQYESIQDRLTKEKQGRTHGDVQESASETGEI